MLQFYKDPYQGIAWTLPSKITFPSGLSRRSMPVTAQRVESAARSDLDGLPEHTP